MTRYVVIVYRSPGRRLAHVRRVTAEGDWQARQVAYQVAEQWAHRARIARYRVTWALWPDLPGAGDHAPIHTGRLMSAAGRRDAGG